MKKFVIIVNALKDCHLAETKKICSYIRKQGAECRYLVSVDEQDGIQKVSAKSIPQDTECILVLGGDGTLIRAARDTVECGIPLIGINLGTLGYLCELEISDVYDAVGAIMQDQYMLEERMMLSGGKMNPAETELTGGVSVKKASGLAERTGISAERTDISAERTGGLEEKADISAERSGGLAEKADISAERLGGLEEKADISAERSGGLKEKTDILAEVDILAEKAASHNESAENGSYHALNDIVIHRTGSLSLVSLDVYVNGRYLNTFKGDGIIFATPTGSTGYNLSAGGPIVDPKAQLLLLTPINSHTLTPRSIVIDPQDEVVVEVGSRRAQRDETVEVSFDGDHGCWLQVGERFKIQRAKEQARILKFSKVSFLEILRKKMQSNGN